MPKIRCPVRYEGQIPAILREFVEQHASKIAEVTWSDGYGDKGAYDAFLRPGWRKCDDIVHTLVNSTAAGLRNEIRAIVPCDCEECRQLQAREDSQEGR